MRRYLIGLAFGAALLAPVPAGAAVQYRRYYDRDARDWHRWDAREERSYRAYLREKHRRYLAYRRAKREEQREYWLWRHAHP